MSEAILSVSAVSARIVRGDKGVVFIFPRLSGVAAVRSVHVFSVEIDGLELLPSAKTVLEAGPVEFELPPVRIVHPEGSYRLGVKQHPAGEEPVEYLHVLEL